MSSKPEDVVRLTAGQAVVRFLQAQFSERDGNRQRAVPAIFGIFGHGNVLGLAQGVEQDGHELPLYQPKNEQAMVHAALGYAKAARRLQALACTASIGPGSTNMLTGAATATTNRLPVLLLPSDTFANRRQGSVLQQLEHPTEADASVNDAFRPLSRYFDRIARPEQLLTALPQAMRVLLDPADTGAVTISLHQDVQGEAFDYPASFFSERTWSVTRRPPAASEIERAAAALRNAQRPLIIAGGGVRYSEAEAALEEFANQLGVPVAETSAGKGSLVGSPLLVGGIGVNGTRAANELARDADVVVCIGTRLSDFTTASNSLFQHEGVKFVSINTNAVDAHKVSAIAVVADAREALVALARELAGVARFSDRARTAARLVEEWKRELEVSTAAVAGEAMGRGEVLSVLNRLVQPDDWVVAAAGWQPGDLLKLWDTPPGSYTHLEFAFSCMGHEIPAAIGIRLRQPATGEVFVVIGDGTYLMNPTELATAVQERAKVTVLLLDNGGYQSISRLALGSTGTTVNNEFRARQDGHRLLDGPSLEIDYVANARSYGCRASVATTVDELRAALADARASDVTTVIVCPVDRDRPLPDSGAFWDLGVPEVASDRDTERRSAEHHSAQSAQRLYWPAS